jgi:hypothetical protein
MAVLAARRDEDWLPRSAFATPALSSGVPLQLGEIVEGIGPRELAGVDEW